MIMAQVMVQVRVRVMGLPLFLMNSSCLWSLLLLPHRYEDTKT